MEKVTKVVENNKELLNEFFKEVKNISFTKDMLKWEFCNYIKDKVNYYFIIRGSVYDI